MNDNDADFATPIALASFRLAFHCLDALRKSDLLSGSARQECTTTLLDLCIQLEPMASDQQSARAALKGIRDLAERLSDDP